MKQFEVFFELYGKKMRTKIIAENKQDAKNKVVNQIKFHKVKEINNPVTKLKDIFGFTD